MLLQELQCEIKKETAYFNTLKNRKKYHKGKDKDIFSEFEKVSENKLNNLNEQIAKLKNI
ncbi:MAG: hypothetical protein KA146_03860 [Leptospiraceae bacterium]|jgi:ribosomal protein S25|nr:hypothetical protein [Leptospiraceae bacterium]